MKPVTVVTQYIPGPLSEKTLHALAQSGLVEEIIIVCREPVSLEIPGCRFLVAGSLQSQNTLASRSK